MLYENENNQKPSKRIKDTTNNFFMNFRFLFQLFLKKFFISINNHKIIKSFGILQRFDDHGDEDK